MLQVNRLDRGRVVNCLDNHFVGLRCRSLELNDGFSNEGRCKPKPTASCRSHPANGCYLTASVLLFRFAVRQQAVGLVGLVDFPAKQMCALAFVICDVVKRLLKRILIGQRFHVAALGPDSASDYFR